MPATTEAGPSPSLGPNDHLAIMNAWKVRTAKGQLPIRNRRPRIYDYNVCRVQARINAVLVDLQEHATNNIEAARRQSAELASRVLVLEATVREYEVLASSWNGHCALLRKALL